MTGPPNQTSSKDQFDPAFIHTRREATVILIVWALALVWSVGYCWLFGFLPAGQEINLILGMPTWVFWGVLFPWVLTGIFSIIFSLCFMADDDLGPDQVEVGVEVRGSASDATVTAEIEKKTAAPADQNQQDDATTSNPPTSNPDGGDGD